MESYFRAGLAPSTQRSYNAAKKRFLNFCDIVKCKSLPATEQVLCRYVSYLADQGLSPKSIKSYLSAIRHLHIANHMHDPKINNMSRLEQVIKGIKRAYARKSPGKRERLPITPEILMRMRSVWQQKSKDFDAIMLWAACCLCFFGFLRAGEITVPSEKAYDSGEHLNVSDISVDSITNPTIMKVKIKASKTDPFRQGVELFIGKTGNSLCPVAAMLAYLAIRGRKEGMLFHFEDDRLLTRDRFVERVRQALTAARIDCKPYSGHSFRIGAATTAAKRGVPPATIQTLGRWESSAYMLYIRVAREELTKISELISRQ